MNGQYGDYYGEAQASASSMAHAQAHAQAQAQAQAHAAQAQAHAMMMDPNAAAMMYQSMGWMDPSMMMGHAAGYGSQGMMYAPGGSRVPRSGVAPQTGYNSKGFPLRMGSPPCTYFAKTGDCNFGTNCKWDHPEEYCSLSKITAAEKAEAVGRNSLGMPLRPDAQPCTFFTKTGTCKFGAACKWDHPESYCHLATTAEGQAALMALATSQPAQPPYGFNAAGYPLRQGTAACLYYAKNGNCKYGSQCKWDHPEAGSETGPSASTGAAAPTIASLSHPYGSDSGDYGKMVSRMAMRPQPY